MEIAESIEDINKKLISHYGLYDDKPNFRVVYSDDMFEKRWMTHTDEGFQLLHPQVREVPKYRHYIQNRFVLERFIPIHGETDLTVKANYEPAWVFNHAETGDYIPPRFDMCQVIIESILEASGIKAGTFVKYKDPEVDVEYRKNQLLKVEKELFGNETSIGDALAHDYGVVNKAEEKHFFKGEE